MTKKLKISKVKRKNQKSHKTNYKKHPHAKKSVNKFPWKKEVQEQQAIRRPKRAGIPSPTATGEDDAPQGEEMLEMVDQEDVAFLRKAVAERSYSIFKKIRVGEPSAPRSKRKEIDDPALENEYEQSGVPQDFKRTKLLLPIKTKQGLVMRATEEDISDEDKEEPVEEPVQEEGKIVEEEDSEAELFHDEGLGELNLEPGQEVTTADLLAAREELLRKRKFKIGVLASALLEEPEQKARNFKVLLDMLKEEQSPVQLTVQKLVIVSLLEIFKDVIPGYQIKHPDVPQGMKLKKDTHRLWSYESALLKAYQLYLQHLEKMTKVLRRRKGEGQRSPGALRLAEVALRCLAQLLASHPYFNFGNNVAQVLVSFLDHRSPAVRAEVAQALKTVLSEDKRGEISLHIVRRINQLVRRKAHMVRADVLSVLLALRLRVVRLDVEKEAELKQRQLENKRRTLILQSKRERKRHKRFQELEKEMMETKAEENVATKHKNLTEVTKLVFTIYFRVLKSAPSSQLLSMTLEGIAKFAHVINLEFYHDLVNVLDHLLLTATLSCREQLLCVQTVFTILSGQGEALNIDPLRFYTHLYRCLAAVHAGNTSEDALVALRAIEMGVLNRRKKVSQQRLLAFCKRLCTMALWQLHGSAMGCLAAARAILVNNSTCEVLLDTDTSHGDGVYLPELPEPEYCGAGAATLWELQPLVRHYHPTVRKVAQATLQGAQGNEAVILLPADVAKLSCSQMAEQFSSSEMAFRPPVPAPTPPRPSRHPRHPHSRIHLTDDAFYKRLCQVEAAVDCKTAEVEAALEHLFQF